jgi:hypothetical protein
MRRLLIRARRWLSVCACYWTSWFIRGTPAPGDACLGARAFGVPKAAALVALPTVFKNVLLFMDWGDRVVINDILSHLRLLRKLRPADYGSAPPEMQF